MGFDAPPMSSIKPITGHMLSASAAAEVAAAALAIEQRIIPPTINYREPDPECDLDYVVEGAREANLDTVMTNSFGFGGHNVSLILRRC
jgi:3-oxoacyl-[acyl-carrier-protein] synthase II